MSANTVKFRAVMDDKVSGPLDKLRDKFDRLQKQGAKGFGLGVGMAVGAKATQALGSALENAGQIVRTFVGAASDQNEVLAKSGVVFKDNAGAIADWGDTTAKKMGISKTAAIGAAAGFGDLFNKLGIMPPAVKEMSTGLVGLASDLASFNNLETDEVLEKIRSGLAGETEPLRSLGVFLNEAKVKAKAMELGLVGLNGELTEGAKVQARYALIMEETASAQGDFARTSDGLANKQRQLDAIMADMSAKVGQSLLPVFTQLATKVVEMAPSIEKLANVLGPVLASSLGIATKPLELLAGALGFLGDVVGNVADAFESDTARMVDASAQLSVEYRKTAKGMGEDAREAARFASLYGDDIEGSLDDIGDEAERTGRRTKDSFESVKKALESAAEKFRDAAHKIIGDYYDPIQIQQELTTIKFDIAEAKKRKAAATTAEELADAAAELTALYRKQEELQADLVAEIDVLSTEGNAALKSLQKNWASALGDARDKARALVVEMVKLRQAAREASTAINTTIGKQQGDQSTGGGGSGVRHSGGPVEANTPYIVGGPGAEELFVPKSDGDIYPNARPASGWGGGGWPTVIKLYLGPGDQRKIAEWIDEELALMPG